jgi:hypothetical protein
MPIAGEGCLHRTVMQLTVGRVSTQATSRPSHMLTGGHFPVGVGGPFPRVAKHRTELKGFMQAPCRSGSKVTREGSPLP